MGRVKKDNEWTIYYHYDLGVVGITRYSTGTSVELLSSVQDSYCLVFLPPDLGITAVSNGRIVGT